MHLSHIPQGTIQNRNVHISVLNGALWDMGQVHYGTCEIDLMDPFFWSVLGRFFLDPGYNIDKLVNVDGISSASVIQVLCCQLGTPGHNA